MCDTVGPVNDVFRGIKASMTRVNPDIEKPPSEVPGAPTLVSRGTVVAGEEQSWAATRK
eukprot:m.118128 g.118128  ORF g.118128 m.118128 type:complete len:59 (-) comp15561_c0_seq6:695-871(-)